jgi:hypothetical protein
MGFSPGNFGPSGYPSAGNSRFLSRLRHTTYRTPLANGQLVTTMLSYVVGAIQNSARTQQTTRIVTCRVGCDTFPIPTSSIGFQILIANPRLKPDLSGNDPNQLQTSNRERMAICRFTHSSRPPLFRLSPAIHRSSPPVVFLIVTPRLEFPATPTKQDSNAIPNRYKTSFFAPLFHSSPVTQHPSLLPQPPGKL